MIQAAPHSEPLVFLRSLATDSAREPSWSLRRRPVMLTGRSMGCRRPTRISVRLRSKGAWFPSHHIRRKRRSQVSMRSTLLVGSGIARSCMVGTLRPTAADVENGGACHRTLLKLSERSAVPCTNMDLLNLRLQCECVVFLSDVRVALGVLYLYMLWQPTTYPFPLTSTSYASRCLLQAAFRTRTLHVRRPATNVGRSLYNPRSCSFQTALLDSSLDEFTRHPFLSGY
jgi:hypothetical protein